MLNRLGNDHRRQRSVLAPSFSPSHIRDLYPKFLETAQVLVEKLQGIIKNSPGGNNKEIEITPWLQPAFGVNLSALDDQQSQIALVFQDLLRELLAQRSIATSGQPFLQYFPTFLIKYLDYLPVKGARNLAAYRRVVDAVARDAVTSARTAMENGEEGGKEILSQIVRECYYGGKQKLSPLEMYAQFGTFLLAGEDTTANAIGWALLELCNHQNYQKMMRDEIDATYRAVHERSIDQLEPSDLDKMPFTQAFMKESLRYHPSLPLVPREASIDAVFPLSKPITLTNGKSSSELYIPKGQGIVINIEGYNRLESVWGKDAHVFRPERWLEGPLQGDVEPSNGVYSHLLSFGGGAHSCIGWRFALQEMQVFLVQMIRNFHFALPDGIRLERELALGSIPIIEGDPSKEQRLPLIITKVE
ncbi:hypothetical protein VKT23_012943 [Stygiomarasmius scandens]|uniref:Cytochrome P450 n=1 Tax=Marasmiellus scandens TaxID=2682957 RepID=A0ABR1J4X4_9AGAR